MALTEEQINSIKAQMLKQIESWPKEQQEQAISQLDSMSPEEFEEFVQKNNIVREDSSQNQEPEKQECIFCSILQGKVPAYKIDENTSSLAILEINPLSSGHSIIISKNHNKLSNSAFSLANKVAKRIKRKLKASEVKIENANILGHNLIEVIPMYKGQELKKKKAEEKELILLQDKIKAKPKPKRQKKIQSQVPISSLPKAPRRVP
ncbi:MAG: hypothetical protein KKB21_03935 [Nanoarchaeota archaeon]|nr:hypothetical protein [Nanoarchaeota archaeon]